MDAEVQRAGGEHHRHESADRKNEKEDLDGAEHRSLIERADHPRPGVPDSVHPVHRREQQILNSAAEIERSGDILERAGDRTAAGVEFVLAGRDEEGGDPHEDQHQGQDGDRRREPALAAFLASRGLRSLSPVGRIASIGSRSHTFSHRVVLNGRAVRSHGAVYEDSSPLAATYECESRVQFLPPRGRVS